MAIIFTYPIKTTSASRNDLILISDSEDKNKTKQISVAKLPGGIDFVGVGGNGTAGKIPKWSTQYDLTDSSIFEDSVTGNIGIGTNIPNAELDIQGGNVPLIRLTETATGGKNFLIGVDTSNSFLRSSGNLLFQAGSLYQGISILESGNVGIGTTNPTEKLVVSGDGAVIKLAEGYSGGSTPDLTTATYDEGLTITGGNQRLVMDVSDVTNGGSYIQSRHSSTSFPTAVYNLALNPLGGNVGIGTTSPAADGLEVASRSLVNGGNTQLFITGNSSGRSVIGLGDDFNNIVQHIVSDHTQNSISFHTLATSVTNNERMRIASNGNVGIGQNNPIAQLDIKDTASQTAIRVINDSYNNYLIQKTRSDNTQTLGIQEFGSNGGLSLVTGGSQRLNINNLGNVGIGTTSLTSKLQVVGLAQYADNAAATLAGLTVGAFYRTGDLLKVVH